MASIKEKHVGGKTYYYLSHTFRDAGKVRYTEIYLGTKIPKNIEQIKSKFLFAIYKGNGTPILKR